MTKSVAVLGLLAALSILGTKTAAQIHPTPSPPSTQTTRDASLSQEENELNRVRKENEEAKAHYYRKLTENLEKPPPEKSFWTRFIESIAQNPAGVFGVLGALIAVTGVLIAARITFLSFLFNYYATLKNQSDTQFYEALKRFGDQDSAAIRASAAGMLATMGEAWVVSIPNQPSLRSSATAKRVVEQPYRQLAINQFLAGLVLEQNETVLTVIASELSKLIPLEQKTTLKGLIKVNLDLQQSLIEALAEYFGAENVSHWAAVNEIILARAEGLTELGSTATLRGFVENFDNPPRNRLGKQKSAGPSKEFTNLLQKAHKAFEGYDASKKAENAAAAARNLRLVAKRLHLNSDLLRIALQGQPSEEANLNGVFLL